MEIRPNFRRAQTANIFLLIYLSLRLLTLIPYIFQFWVIYQTKNHLNYWNKDIGLIMLLDQILALIANIMAIPTMIFFIMWFRRAYFNLHIKSEHLKFSEAWAAGAWFIPIANLVLPFVIMKELFSGINSNKDSSASKKHEVLLFTWWTFWIICTLLNYTSILYTFKPSSFDNSIIIAILNVLNTIFIIFAGLLVIRIIKTYNRIESQMLMNETDSDISRHLAPEQFQ
jgi:hypothetical protein